jgi:hypothetical protein
MTEKPSLPVQDIYVTGPQLTRRVADPPPGVVSAEPGTAHPGPFRQFSQSRSL